MRMKEYCLEPMPLPSQQRAAKVSGAGRVELYRLLADESRLRILALCAEEELSVGELGALLSESQPQISRKVAPLRQAGLLQARRDGTRTWLRLVSTRAKDPVIGDALGEGRRRCQDDGSLARLPGLVAAREEQGRALFETAATKPLPPSEVFPPTHLAHLAGLWPLLPGRSLAVDVGTGEGVLLDVLVPLYERVIAVDRSQARLARCAARIAEHGYAHVSLYPGSYEEAELLQRVDSAGGADLVYAARTLHHASRPAQAVECFARLLRRGGHLVLLEYLPHFDESLRSVQGDVWLGFSAEELRSFATGAGLEVIGEGTIPAALHRQGPDAHLGWHTLVARKPLSTLNPGAGHNGSTN